MPGRAWFAIAFVVAAAVVGVGGTDPGAHADNSGSISGTVFVDEDLDGRRDPGEQVAAGRTVRLIQYGDETNVESTTLSGTDGRYRFDGLDRDQTYAVDVIRDEETPCVIQTYGDVTPDMEWSGQDRGVLPPGDIELSGTLTDDENANGVPDAGEPGLEGWSIDVQSRDAGPVFCGVMVETGAGGEFSVGNLPPYKFDLAPQPPSSPSGGRWVGTFPAIAVGPLPTSRVFSWTVDLTDRATEPRAGAGFHLLSGTSGISGFVYTDRNLNGTFDSDEYLVDCGLIRSFFQAYWQLPIGSFRIDPGIESNAMPCENGAFQLNGLEAGTYMIGMPWCGIPGSAEHRLQGTSQATVALSAGQHVDNVVIAICPSADTGPAPDARTPTPVVATTLVVGSPDTGSGGGSSADLALWLVPAMMLAGVASASAALFRARRRPLNGRRNQ